MKGNAFTTLPEPRLTMRLEQILKEQGRLDPAASLTLRTPPTSVDSRDGVPRGVAAGRDVVGEGEVLALKEI
jgi:hypothetical protein